MHPERQITVALPDLVRKLVSALITAGRPDVAAQFDQVLLRSVSYDSANDAGYLYVTESRPLNLGEQDTIRVHHGECVPLDLPGIAVIDVDNFGRLMGAELLGYPDVFRHLGVAA